MDFKLLACNSNADANYLVNWYTITLEFRNGDKRWYFKMLYLQGRGSNMCVAEYMSYRMQARLDIGAIPCIWCERFCTTCPMQPYFTAILSMISNPFEIFRGAVMVVLPLLLVNVLL